MVKRLLLFIIVSSAASATALAASPTVIKVTITQNGARSNSVSGDETAAMCSRFRLTPAAVRQYFARSVRASTREYSHDLEMSRCYAAGTVTFSDGTNGHWFIDLERRGELILAGNRRVFYYCKSCTSPPFDEPYDPDKEG